MIIYDGRDEIKWQRLEGSFKYKDTPTISRKPNCYTTIDNMDNNEDDIFC